MSSTGLEPAGPRRLQTDERPPPSNHSARAINTGPTGSVAEQSPPSTAGGFIEAIYSSIEQPWVRGRDIDACRRCPRLRPMVAMNVRRRESLVNPNDATSNSPIGSWTDGAHPPRESDQIGADRPECRSPSTPVRGCRDSTGVRRPQARRARCGRDELSQRVEHSAEAQRRTEPSCRATMSDGVVVTPQRCGRCPRSGNDLEKRCGATVR